MCSRLCWWCKTWCPTQEIQDAQQQGTLEPGETEEPSRCCLPRKPKPLPKVMMPVEEEEGPPLTDPRADPRILRGAAMEEYGDASVEYGDEPVEEPAEPVEPVKKNGKQKQTKNHVRFG